MQISAAVGIDTHSIDWARKGMQLNSGHFMPNWRKMLTGFQLQILIFSFTRASMATVQMRHPPWAADHQIAGKNSSPKWTYNFISLSFTISELIVIWWSYVLFFCVVMFKDVTGNTQIRKFAKFTEKLIKLVQLMSFIRSTYIYKLLTMFMVYSMGRWKHSIREDDLPSQWQTVHSIC